jgi:hypothetical protein
MIVVSINSIQVASCVSTLQENALSRGCFISSRLVWDPRIILSFILVQLIDHRVVMEFLEDNKSLGREDCNVPIFGFLALQLEMTLWVYVSLTRGVI